MSSMHSTTYSSINNSNPNATGKTHLRLTRRGRIVVAAFVTLLLVLIGFGGFLYASGAAFAASESGGREFTYITVGSGESLWNLANDLDSTSDPRDVISDIMSLNQLQSSDLVPGQQLAIPTAYDPNH